MFLFREERARCTTDVLYITPVRVSKDSADERQAPTTERNVTADGRCLRFARP